MVDIGQYHRHEFTAEEFERDVLPYFLKSDLSVLFYENERLIIAKG